MPTKMRLVKRKFYELKFLDQLGSQAILNIRRDGNAEGILRGLIHEGYQVTIREFEKTVEVEDDDEKLCEAVNVPIAPTNMSSRPWED